MLMGRLLVALLASSAVFGVAWVGPAGAESVAPPVGPSVSTPEEVPAELHPAAPVSEQVLSREAAAGMVSDGALKYYQEQFGTSATVARERLTTQAMAPGVGDTLRARYGDAVADTWFDNGTGTWKVAATSSVPADGIARVFRARGLSSNYRLQRVGYTHSALVAAAETVRDGLEGDLQAGRVRVGVRAGAVSVTMAAGLRAGGPSASKAAASARARVTGAVATVQPDEGPPVTQVYSTDASLLAAPGVSCSAEPWCDTLIGGDEYWAANGAGCTMAWFGGFNYSTGQWQPVMLTADHCTRGMGGAGTPVNTFDLASNVEFGKTYNGQLGYTDWGYLYLTNPAPAGLNPGRGTPYGGYVNWSSGGSVSRLDYVYSTGRAPTGLVVCHQGWGSWRYLGSGTQCGTIGSTNTSVTWGDGTQLTGMIEVDGTLGCKGDSGGPFNLATSATAVGIFSTLSTELSGGNCGSTLWITPVSVPLQAYAGVGFVLYGG